MNTDWIAPVLEDIRVFSKENQMPKTEAKLSEVLRVLESEQGNANEAGSNSKVAPIRLQTP